MITDPLKPEIMKELAITAKQLVAKGRGILAADESTPTVQKRFQSIQVESTEKSRRDYRELLFTAPGIEEFISGVILFDETIRQKSSTGITFPDLLSERGIIPGIKVDKGLALIPGTKGEKATQGLDGLHERLQEYKKLGARFAKWRAVISIANHTPSSLSIDINAHALARYAAICQFNGIVPIVEPEVLIDGSHDIATCERVSEFTLCRVFEELSRHKVFLEGMLHKPSMVITGKDNYFKILCADPDGFPSIPKFIEEEFIEIDKNVLLDMIKKTAFIILGDRTKHGSSGIFLDICENQVKMVTNDGRRLGEIKKKIDNPNNISGNCIIPIKGILQMQKITLLVTLLVFQTIRRNKI